MIRVLNLHPLMGHNGGLLVSRWCSGGVPVVSRLCPPGGRVRWLVPVVCRFLSASLRWCSGGPACEQACDLCPTLVSFPPSWLCPGLRCPLLLLFALCVARRCPGGAGGQCPAPAYIPLCCLDRIPAWGPCSAPASAPCLTPMVSRWTLVLLLWHPVA